MALRIDISELMNSRPPRFWSNCEIVNTDILQVGGAVIPRLIEVRLPDLDGGLVEAMYYGGFNLLVGDFVQIRRDTIDSVYTVVGPGGSSGLAEGFMNWLDVWVPIEYKRFDVVRDEEWTMVANKTTTDRAAPVPVGDPFFLLPDVPAWNINSVVDTVESGLQLTAITNLFVITSFRVWVQDVSGNTLYRVIIKDLLTGQFDIGAPFSGNILTTPGWLTVVPSGAPVLTPGAEVQFLLLAENFTATSTFFGDWFYTEDNTDFIPAAGGVHRRLNRTTIRFNKTDDAAADRSAELLAVLPGSMITSDNGADYEVIFTTDAGATVVYDIVGVNPIPGLQTWTFVVPIPLSTDYVDLTSFWSPNPLDPDALPNGVLTIGTGGETIDFNAYGFDFEAQEFTFSPDWDLLAFSGTISSSASQAIQATSESKPTGLGDGGELNIGPGANDIEVIEGFGIVINSYDNPGQTPLFVVLSWTQINTAITEPAVAGAIAHFTLSDGGTAGPIDGTNLGVINEYSSFPSPPTVRDQIYLGFAIFNGATWGEVSSPIVINNVAHAFDDFINTVVGPTFTLTGGDVTEAALFTLDRAEGIVWELNRNWHINKKDPHRESFLQDLGFQWRYTNRDFSDVGALTDTVDPLTWDNAGVVEPIGGGALNTTIQRLFIDPRDNFWVLWGQTIHDNFAEAQGNIGSDAASTVVPTILNDGSLFLGFIITQRLETDWGTENAEFFLPAEAVGGAGGAAGGSNWATDAAGINYQLGNVGIGGDSQAGAVKLLVTDTTNARVRIAPVNVTTGNSFLEFGDGLFTYSFTTNIFTIANTADINFEAGSGAALAVHRWQFGAAKTSLDLNEALGFRIGDGTNSVGSGQYLQMGGAAQAFTDGSIIGVGINAFPQNTANQGNLFLNYTTSAPTQINRLYLSRMIQVQHSANVDISLINYRTSEGANIFRTALNLDGVANIVAVSNRAANGTVEIRANSAVGGGGGEATVGTFKRVAQGEVLNLSNLPTAVTGLVSGDLWRNGNVVNII